MQEKSKFHFKIKNSHFIIEKLPSLGFVTTAVHCVYYFAPPFSYQSMNTRIMQNFEGVGSKNDFLITRHLSSGWVRRTRHQISAGADAPVAPALTRSLPYFVGSVVNFGNSWGKNKHVGLISDQNWSFS